MKIAITGGTGFIGKRLIARHLAMGDEVVYLTRKKPQFLTAAKPFIGDVLSPLSELKRFTESADVLYHCAAEIRDMSKMHATNVTGTQNLIDAACHQVGRWVQLSSTGVYGKNAQGNVTEDTALSPSNLYEKSKAESDALVISAASQYPFSVFILRPSNVYGVDMPNQSLFNLIKMVDRGLFFYIGERSAIANYVHVENVVDALVLCATAEANKADTYIVSDYCDLTDLMQFLAAALSKPKPSVRLPESLVRAVANVLSKWDAFPLKPSRIDALTSQTIYLTNKIEAELGFKNHISIQNGMADLVHHWKQAHVK